MNSERKTVWQQITEKKDRFIGGVLREDPSFGYDGGQTEIVDITLSGEEADGSLFEVVGKDFSCMFNTRYGGISGGTEGGGLSFSSTFGLSFSISEKGQSA